MARETVMTMKDFDLGTNLGQIKNKEDRRVYIEKANALASLSIKAAKKAKKMAPTNREAEEYIENVRKVIREDKIPLQVTLDMYDERIGVMKQRQDKLMRLKDRQKGFLSKSDVRKLEQWIEAKKQLEFERDDFIEQNKPKEEKFDVVAPKKKAPATSDT